MGWSIVRALAFAGLVLCGTTSCILVNLGDEDGDDAPRRCPACAHGGKSDERAAPQVLLVGPDGQEQPAPPGLRPGVVQIYKNVGGDDLLIGFGSQDPNNPAVAVWVLHEDESYPVNLEKNHWLKLKQLTLDNETAAQLCTRAKDVNIPGPRKWRVSQALISLVNCPP